MQGSFDVEIIAVGSRSFNKIGHRYVSLPPHTEYKLKLTNNHHTRCDAEVSIDTVKVGNWRINANSSIVVERPEHAQRKFTFVGENSKIARNTGAVSGSDVNGLVGVVFKPAKPGRFYEVPQYVSQIRSPRSMEKSSDELSNTRFRDMSPQKRSPLSQRRSPSPQRRSPSPQRSIQNQRRSQDMSLFGSMSPVATWESMPKSRVSSSRVSSYNSSSDLSSGVTVLGRGSNQEFDSTSALRTDEIDWTIRTEIIIRLVVRENYSEDYVPLSHTPKIPPRLDNTHGRYY